MVLRLGTLVDISSLGICESSDYTFFRAEQGQLKPIDRRAVKLHKEYCKVAKRTSTASTTALWVLRMSRSNPLSFRPVMGKYEGTVLGLGIGCFGERSAVARRLRHARGWRLQS